MMTSTSARTGTNSMMMDDMECVKEWYRYLCRLRVKVCAKKASSLMLR